jgi:predicted anti-sigma-YlaC factor YlaD
VPFSGTDCARARESVSVQLDGELPELELDRLETHLRICPDCSVWAAEVRGVTHRLREAALEEPAERFVLPRRGRRWTVSSAVALASAAAVVATMFVAPGPQNASLRSLAAGPPRPGSTYDVAAGVVYPPHAALGSVTLGVSSPIVAPWPVRPL